MLRLRIPSPAGFLHVHGVFSKHEMSLGVQVAEFQGWHIHLTKFGGPECSKRKASLKP
jgi:hypothetical protein